MEVVASAMKAFDTMVAKDQNGEEPLYRSKGWKRVQRAIFTTLSFLFRYHSHSHSVLRECETGNVLSMSTNIYVGNDITDIVYYESLKDTICEILVRHCFV